MSTNDVPGADPKNNDQLALGCWAEHADGSLIFVENTEGGRVVYSIFDMSAAPPVEYRHAMPETNFKREFTWDVTGVKGKSKDKWTWHDKTAFPWDRIIKAGFPDGAKAASAEHILSAAARVAESLRLHGAEVAADAVAHRGDHTMPRSDGIFAKLGRALDRLAGDGDRA